jgi:hypothetical protein
LNLKFPSGNKVQEIQRQFMQQSRIPGIVGAIDCTYIPIQSPGGDTIKNLLRGKIDDNFFYFGSKLSLISANIVNTHSLFSLYLSINSSSE